MSELIQVNQQGRTLEIVMNRPERKNALSMDMYAEMAEAIEQARKNQDIRALLIRGSQTCFTSGNDLDDFMNNPPSEDGNNSVTHFMRALFECEKPVVAAVNGNAVGIGTTMLLHCDLVYAGENAKFQMPFANLGLCPEYASSQLLPRMLGHVKAAELLLLGEPFDAVKAEASGIINSVYADDLVLQKAQEACEKLEQQPPAALKATKKLMREPLVATNTGAMDAEMKLFASGLQSAEFNEAVTAFFEKRKPDFSTFS